VRPWTRVVSIWPPPQRWGETRVVRGRRLPETMSNRMPFTTILGRELLMFRSLVSTPDDLAGEARSLSVFKPGFIICRPSHLRRLGSVIHDHGLRVAPEGLQVTNEVLTPTCKRQLEDQFGAKVYRSYGSAEFLALGFECGAQMGIHISDDFEFAEVLSNDGEAAGPGEAGELVLTSFNNDRMPLIRYRTEDFVVRAESDRCGCGSYLLRLATIQGRRSDGLVTATGVRALPIKVADQIESEFGLRDFQLLQLSLDTFVLRVLDSGSVTDGVRSAVKEYIEGLISCPIRLTVEERPATELWMKNRPVVSRLLQNQ
jgi:phenylacetate-CoA ligase